MQGAMPIMSQFLWEFQAKVATQYWYSSCGMCVGGVCVCVCVCVCVYVCVYVCMREVVIGTRSILSLGRSMSVGAEIECAEMSMTWLR